MNSSYRRLIAWSALASVVLIALSAGIAAASPGVPVGGNCGAPLLAASYEIDAPCVPFDACTGTTTLWTAAPCSENDRIAQCVEIAETQQVITSLCRDLVPLFDVCLPDGSRRWSVDPCDYVAPDIDEPQVVDPVLPRTGNGSTVALIAALFVALGALCLVVRGIGRDMDDDWGAL
jgi:LPXTG cell wall anchor motif